MKTLIQFMQKNTKLAAIIGITLCVAVYYLFNQYEGKALWDWLELLIIPAVLGIGAILFSQRENQRALEMTQRENEIERELAREKRNEDIFQNFIDKMTELMLEKNLLEAENGDKVLDITRVRITSTLRALHGDTIRLNGVIQFLREAGLLIREERLGILAKSNLRSIDLKEAYLSEIDLTGADLRMADLSEAKMRMAVLSGAKLKMTDMSKALLSGADLNRAILNETKLNLADLWGANLSNADLRKADLRGAIVTKAIFAGAQLPDGTRWTTNTDMARFTDSKHPDFWDWEKEMESNNAGKTV